MKILLDHNGDPATPAHLKKHIDRLQQALPRAASVQTVIDLE
jgi:hypothetical protein